MSLLAPRPSPAVVGAAWLIAMAATAGLGWATGTVTRAGDLVGSPAYQALAAGLLAIGLYGSTYGIRLPEARKHLGAIVFATTVGVALKAALIMAAVYLVIDPRYAIVGLAMAQIDPLAVSAMLRRTEMSPETRAILQSWASFDDPVTALLTVYAATWLMADGDPAAPGDGVVSYLGGLTANLGFAVAGLVLWWLLRRAGGRRDPRRWTTAVFVAALLTLVALLGFATASFLMLGVALLGLFFRPGLDRLMGPVLTIALLVATFALGLLMVDGIAWVAGAALGLAAFLAQMVAAAVLPARLARTDRIRLALGQQNGITAIILALSLEPLLPGTVAMVAPAVLVVNTLHMVTNVWWDVPRRSTTGGVVRPPRLLRRGS